MNGMIRFLFHFSNSPVSDLEHLYCVSLEQIWSIYGKHIIKKNSIFSTSKYPFNPSNLFI